MECPPPGGRPAARPTRGVPLRPLGRRLLEILAREVPFPGPVVELGSFRVEGQESLADLRPLFPAREYVGCDLRPGSGVDRIEDVEALGFPDGSVASLVSADALEHVRRPWRAAREAYRVLRPGGTAVFLTCLDFKIHNHPDDYWRFTPSALDFLFESFPVRMIGSQGAPDFPHTVFAILFKPPLDFDPHDLEARLAAALSRDCRLPVSPLRRAKWRVGEWLLAKRRFRRLRQGQEIRVALTATV